MCLSDLPENLRILHAAVAENSAALAATDIPTNVTVKAVSWGGSNLDEEDKYAVVIAADCVYCHTLHGLLAATAAATAAANGGKVLLADEERWADNDKWWAETAASHGLVLESVTELPQHSQMPRKVWLRQYRVEPAA